MIIVPDRCIPLLKEHRTHYTGDFVKSYSNELESTYKGFAPYLPRHGYVLDIGCGMAGIDILLDRHYQGKAEITLVDKNGQSDRINAGFHESADAFAHYHSFDHALEMMAVNGVENVETVDLLVQQFPRKKFSVVISLLSWGFHYPIDTYAPRVCRGGVIIADIRKGTDGIEKLGQYGQVVIVHESKKYSRVVVKC